MGRGFLAAIRFFIESRRELRFRVCFGNPEELGCDCQSALAGGFMAISFTLNGKSQSLDVDPQMPLLWVLRDTLNMTGTKFGCGMALCGACTVHINGEATRSCITPISAVAGKKV